MAQAKMRGAVLLAAILVIGIAVAIFVTPGAWTFVPAMLIVLVMHLASPVDDTPDLPNSPVKVWFFIATACGGIVLIVLGLTSDRSDLLWGAFLLALALPPLWMIRQGRNPWWMRGWADYAGRR